MSDDEERLYYAIENDGLVTLKQLIEEGCNINLSFPGTNQLGKSLLHLCCEKGRYECAQLLLDSGARPAVLDAWYQTPLIYSVNTRRDNMVKLLLSHKRCKRFINLRDRFGLTALHFAAKLGDITCMEPLLAADCDVDAVDNIGRTALHHAAAEEDDRTDAMRVLLENGCTVNYFDRKSRRSALHKVIIANTKTSGRLDGVKLLLENGANPNMVDFNKLTTVMLVIHRSRQEARQISDLDLDIVRTLIEWGHNINICTHGRKWYEYSGTAVMATIKIGCVPLLEVILGHGADPDQSDDKGRIPICYAISEDKMQIIHTLVAANCSLLKTTELTNDSKTRQVTPFQYALFLKKIEICEWLLAAGYDLSGEHYLLTNQDVPEELVLNLELWTGLLGWMQNARSLKLQCCCVLRKLLGTRIHKHVKSLDIAPGIRDLILLKTLPV